MRELLAGRAHQLKEERVGQRTAAENTLTLSSSELAYICERVGEVREGLTVEVRPLPGSIGRPPSRQLLSMGQPLQAYYSPHSASHWDDPPLGQLKGPTYMYVVYHARED